MGDNYNEPRSDTLVPRHRARIAGGVGGPNWGEAMTLAFAHLATDEVTALVAVSLYSIALLVSGAMLARTFFTRRLDRLTSRLELFRMGQGLDNVARPWWQWRAR